MHYIDSSSAVGSSRRKGAGGGGGTVAIPAFKMTKKQLTRVI